MAALMLRCQRLINGDRSLYAIIIGICVAQLSQGLRIALNGIAEDIIGNNLQN